MVIWQRFFKGYIWFEQLFSGLVVGQVGAFVRKQMKRGKMAGDLRVYVLLWLFINSSESLFSLKLSFEIQSRIYPAKFFFH